MNLIRYSLNSHLQFLRLRGQSRIRSQLGYYKFLSMNSLMHCKESNKIQTLNSIYDISEIENNTSENNKTSKLENVNYFNEEEMNDDYKNYSLHKVPTGFVSCVFGSNEFSESANTDENVEDSINHSSITDKAESFGNSNNCINTHNGVSNDESQYNEKYAIHSEKTVPYDTETNGNGNRSNFLWDKHKNNISNKFDSSSKILRKGFGDFKDHSFVQEGKCTTKNTVNSNLYKELKSTIVLPDGCPILKNEILRVMNPVSNQYFVAPGVKFVKLASEYGLRPSKVFYSDDIKITNLNLNPNYVEIYKISTGDFQKALGVRSITFLGFYKRQLLNDLAYAMNKELPMVIVTHGIRKRFLLSNLIANAANIGCEKFLSTCESGFLFHYKIIKSSQHSFFKLPIFEKLSWNEIDRMIDSNHSVFLISPENEASSSMFGRNKSFRIKSVDIFSTDLWKKKKIFLIISNYTPEEDEELLHFCKKWNARKLIVADVANYSPLQMSLSFMIEIKRQHFYKGVSNCKNLDEQKENLNK